MAVLYQDKTLKADAEMTVAEEGLVWASDPPVEFKYFNIDKNFGDPCAIKVRGVKLPEETIKAHAKGSKECCMEFKEKPDGKQVDICLHNDVDDCPKAVRKLAHRMKK